jgi:hypothetical protein
MKLLLPCLLLLGPSYAQQPALPDTIHEIAPLPEVEIRVDWENPVFTANTFWLRDHVPRSIISNKRRKYDTLNELIFMSCSDVWMADPSARTGRD